MFEASPQSPASRALRPFLIVALALGVWGCSKGKSTEAEVTPAAPPKAADAAPIPFTVTQEISGAYTPGAPFVVKVTMNYTGSEPVTALALQSVLPQGWTYGGIRGELKPAIDPPTGTSGQLTMIWIQTPTFPATVEYALDVPTWAEGTYTLTAQAIYRGLGGELQSPIHETSISRSR